jgi:hypothetical protein
VRLRDNAAVVAGGVKLCGIRYTRAHSNQKFGGRTRGRHYFAEAEKRGTPLFAEGFAALKKWREKRDVEIGPELQDIAEGLLPSSPWTSWVLNRPALPMRADGSIEPPIAGWALVEKEYSTIAASARSVGQIGTADQASGTGFVTSRASS